MLRDELNGQGWESEGLKQSKRGNDRAEKHF